MMLLALAALSGLPVAPARPAGFETVGLYVWSDTPDQHAFWRACGINTLQLCDTGWSLRPDLLDDYHARLAAGLHAQKRDGFRVWVILFANIAQWKGPEERDPTGIGRKFHPGDQAAMDERLSYLARSVRALHEADGFTFFAGDPGGVPAELGPAAARDWTTMARAVEGVVRREAPRAGFNLNPWAIAMWSAPSASAMTSAFWLAETEATRAVLDEPGLLGPERGLEIAPHNYYRPLPLRCFAGDGIPPERFPSGAEVARLRDRGTRRVWAWPYFLLDEADDGDVGPEGRRGARVQIETRYIRRLVREMRGIGADGIIGNWSYAGYLPRALNTYAFGRFCRDASATPERVLDEYASHVAERRSRGDLAQVLRFIENDSNWHRKLPEAYRLPNLACELKSADQALARLARVVPRRRPSFPLPEPPAKYLARVRERLDAMSP